MTRMRALLPGMSAVLLSLAALVVSLCGLHQQRESRHRMQAFLKEGDEVVQNCFRLLEEKDTDRDDLEGVRNRVEALWEAMGKPKSAASPETAIR